LDCLSKSAPRPVMRRGSVSRARLRELLIKFETCPARDSLAQGNERHLPVLATANSEAIDEEARELPPCYRAGSPCREHAARKPWGLT
jgi:hypothetical protein